jgi:hypothetical protein
MTDITNEQTARLKLAIYNISQGDFDPTDDEVRKIAIAAQEPAARVRDEALTEAVQLYDGPSTCCANSSGIGAGTAADGNITSSTFAWRSFGWTCTLTANGLSTGSLVRSEGRSSRTTRSIKRRNRDRDRHHFQQG